MKSQDSRSQSHAAFHLDIDADGIGLLTLSCPNDPVNKLSAAILQEFETLLGTLPEHSNLRSLILISGKTDCFIAGADMEEIQFFQSPEQGQQLSRKGQELFARLEGLHIPLVAAIHGSCLGAGLELALVCHYRVISSHEKTVLALPEVQLGLIPAVGGTQRLPKLIGLAPALELILTGKRVHPRKALQLGLVDEVVAPEQLLQVARRAATHLAAQSQPPGSHRHRSWTARSLESNSLSRAVVFAGARRKVLAKTRGLYPAPGYALQAVRAGYSRDPQKGYAEEAQRFGELAMTGVCRELLRLFFATTAAKKHIPPEVPIGEEQAIGGLGMVGGGFMGTGIAVAAAQCGLSVRMRERDVAAAGHALFRFHQENLDLVKRGRPAPLQARLAFERVSICTDWTGFRTVDLVIEAVDEDLKLKQSILSELETATHPDCILASNTSSLPVARIAENAVRPERVIGLHFFSPVSKMPLVEIVITPATAGWVTATALSFGRWLGKTPIVVRDGPGFFTTRILSPYLNEAALLLEEGAGIEAVDAAMLNWGFPIGPLALMDEIGIDISAKVARIMSAAFENRMSMARSIDWIGADGRKGRKSGHGYYRYSGKHKQVDTSVYRLIPDGWKKRTFSAEEIQRRLSMSMINEAVLCLQDGILFRPLDGDVGAVLGLGFPPFRGGPFRFLDSLGASEAVHQLLGLAAKHGERFQPAELLLEMARNQGAFYGR
jgi:3-hydroxyacyl-CoA dehydrogenase/enoyl-CoA hydratase/3-hydroxybutyryl-CoA epimerase